MSFLSFVQISQFTCLKRLKTKLLNHTLLVCIGYLLNLKYPFTLHVKLKFFEISPFLKQINFKICYIKYSLSDIYWNSCYLNWSDFESNTTCLVQIQTRLTCTTLYENKIYFSGIVNYTLLPYANFYRWLSIWKNFFRLRGISWSCQTINWWRGAKLQI